MKKWFENFWYYYKWHTIIGAIILVCILVGTHAMNQNDGTDLQMLILGKNCGSFEGGSEQMSAAVEPYLLDITEDGKVLLGCREMKMTDDSSSDLAMLQQLVADFAAGESRIFITEEEYLPHFTSQEVLLPLDGEVNEEIASTGYRDEAGNLVAVKIQNQDLLKKMGLVVGEDAYLAIRTITPAEMGKEKVEREHENALRLFKELIK